MELWNLPRWQKEAITLVAFAAVVLLYVAGCGSVVALVGVAAGGS